LGAFHRQKFHRRPISPNPISPTKNFTDGKFHRGRISPTENFGEMGFDEMVVVGDIFVGELHPNLKKVVKKNISTFDLLTKPYC
jgi:hypothetical protein